MILDSNPNPDPDRLVDIVENVPAEESFTGVAVKRSSMNADDFREFALRT